MNDYIKQILENAGNIAGVQEQIRKDCEKNPATFEPSETNPGMFVIRMGELFQYHYYNDREREQLVLDMTLLYETMVTPKIGRIIQGAQSIAKVFLRELPSDLATVTEEAHAATLKYMVEVTFGKWHHLLPSVDDVDTDETPTSEQVLNRPHLAVGLIAVYIPKKDYLQIHAQLGRWEKDPEIEGNLKLSVIDDVVLETA